MKKFFSIFLALALVLAILPVAGAKAQSPVAYESSISIQNLSPDAGLVTLTFYNLQGFVVGTADAPIPGNASISFYRGTMPIAPGFDGSVVVASNVPTAGISNLVGLKTGAVPVTYGAFSAFNEGSQYVYLPTLMKGNYGYDTFFYVQNLGDAVATVDIAYSDGLNVQLNGIKPGAAKAVKQSAEQHAGAVFSATLSSEQNIAVTVAQTGPTLLAYNGFGMGTVYPIMPLFQANNYGYVTGIQIQNTGGMSTDVTVAYTPGTAGTACTETQTIPAGGSVTFGLAAFNRGVPSSNCVKELFVGSAEVTVNSQSQNLVAVVNQLNSADFKGGSYNAFDTNQGASKAIFPLIMDRNYGYFTGWSIVNVGEAEIAAEGVVCVVKGGEIEQTIKSPAIPAGGAWTMNHNNKIGDKFVGSAICTTDGTVIGVLNQLGTGEGFTGVDSLLVSEAFLVD
jgi:hypothetical protein